MQSCAIGRDLKELYTAIQIAQSLRRADGTSRLDIFVYAMVNPAIAVHCDASFYRKESLSDGGATRAPMYCYY